MINQLFNIYPNAIYSEKADADSNRIWFKANNTDSYIGIPIDDISDREVQLLQVLLSLEKVNNTLPLPPIAEEWRNFLYSNGSFPDTKSDQIRFIHFSIKNIRGEFHYNEWEEAIQSLFSNEIIIVPMDRYHGVIVEDGIDLSVTEAELYPAIEAFESDFFIKMYLYFGHYHKSSEELKKLFQLEQNLLDLSVKKHPEERIITREKITPMFLYHNVPLDDRHILFADIHKLLSEDPELSKTIKVYIENQSNATLTAKQLFMHRNSLQYRIDKFIEKSGIDIKTFHGAFFAYLACLHIDQY